jgi:hypothetical protein
MFSSSCNSSIRADTTKRSRGWLTVYFALVFLLASWPWNVLLVVAVIGVPRVDLAIENDRCQREH